MSSLRWSVVVPVKQLERAKTRLEPLPPEVRAEIALALAADTVSAAVRCAVVDSVVVVTDDDRAAELLGALGAQIVADEPFAGLNPALEHGVAVARAARPDAAVAALSADLPAATPATLELALAAAADHDRACVADASGLGTTLLTARPGVALNPAFGAGSLDRHRRSGAVVLEPPELVALRQDVDTLTDLASAIALGIGEHTAQVLLRHAVTA